MKLINFKKYFNYKKYINFNFNFNVKKYTSFNFKRYKRYNFVLNYAISFVVASIVIYLSVPLFFDYGKSKKIIENTIYKEFRLKTTIVGKINYDLFPSPQIRINNLLIKDFLDSKKNLGKVENAILKIPAKKIVSLNKIDFVKLKLDDAAFDINLNKYKDYKNYFKKFKSKNINISSGKIKLFDDKKNIAKLDIHNFNFNSNDLTDNLIFRGSLAGDEVFFSLKNKKDSKPITIITLNYPNLKFRSNAKIFPQAEEKNVKGNVTLYLYDNKMNIDFSIKDSDLKIEKGNIKNRFLNGKIHGNLNFSPFFRFDLNLDLKSFNFGNFSKLLLAMDDNSLSNFFAINDKINGELNLNINKFYSSSKIIKALESRVQFVNNDIMVEQLLLDLGKIGAADVIGSFNNINNNKKFTFKNNLFIDNPKYFYSKFGIYNKNIDPENLFVSGIFNLQKPKIFFDEIIAEKKMTQEDLEYFEKEFNEIIFEKGYMSFFDFLKVKEFVQAVTSKDN